MARVRAPATVALATATSKAVSCFGTGPDACLIGTAGGVVVAGSGLMVGPGPVTDGDVVAGVAVGPALTGLTWNDRLTSGAAAYRALPPCEAVIVHGPAATVVTTEPATVHTDDVSELNDTVSPDDADADKVTGAPIVTSGGCPNVIVCAAGPALTGLTWNDRLTSGAAAYRALPPCEAVIVHGPAATVVTTEPATVHTDDVSELNDTVSPDDADADKVTGAPIVTSGGCPNVIVCAAGLTWNDCVTGGAAA